jgi:hypothetical protein
VPPGELRETSISTATTFRSGWQVHAEQLLIERGLRLVVRLGKDADVVLEVQNDRPWSEMR